MTERTKSAEKIRTYTLTELAANLPPLEIHGLRYTVDFVDGPLERDGRTFPIQCDHDQGIIRVCRGTLGIEGMAMIRLVASAIIGTTRIVSNGNQIYLGRRAATNN
jgi:hypothetical protein